MPNIKISELPVATVVNDADVVVLNQAGVTKQAARSLVNAPTGTLPVANGGTGVTASSGASSVVLRDASQNITANYIIEGFTSVAASGTQITLTVASTPNFLVTGSGGQVIQLPNATTLQNGVVYSFNNNQSSGAISVNNNSGTLVASIPSGGFAAVSLLSNAIAAGSWERHEQAPSNVTWSTNTLDYPGSITSATWNGNAVAVNRGGTGATTLTGVLKGNGTGAVTAAEQLAVADGGTGAATGTEALANLGNTIFPVSARQSGNLAPASQTATTLTYAAGAGIGGTTTVDGYTLVQGDVVLLISQATTHQNGPWVITTLGTASVGAVLTRPSWFTTGTAKSGTFCLVQYGTAATGFIISLSGPTNTTGAAIAIGTSAITIALIWGRIPLATTGSNVFTGPQTFRANGSGAQNCPFIFQAGVALMATPIGNAVEWFSDQMYLTNAAGVRTTNTNHVAIPATATSTGQVGQIAVDNAGSWLYVCTATNVWKRIALTSF